MNSDNSNPEIERARREGAELERQRIGQLLHDHLCQFLLGAAFSAQAAAAKCDPESTVRAEIEEVARLINASVQEVRELVRGLSATN